MKKMALAAALSAIALWAAPASAQSAFEGFHIGASVGPTVGKFQASVPAAGNLDLGATGVGGALSAGYGFGLGSGWIVDPELNIDYSNASAEVFGSKIEMGMGYGGSVSVGYALMRDVLWYAKLGYQSTEFKITGDASKRVGGVLIGTGLKFALDDSWSVKVAYDWIPYSKISSTSLGADVSPTVNQVRVGIDYRFGAW